MLRSLLGLVAALGILAGATFLLFAGGTPLAAETASRLPSPLVDPPATPAPGVQEAVLSGGCFWGMQLVFEHVVGVTGVTAGYAGGPASDATYEEVSTGTTGHAESVRITFDPSKVSYGQILRVFFSVAHDPTTRNRQGPDVGSQYRSVIWYSNPEQERVARAYIAQLDRAHTFTRPIVTEVAPLRGFYPAESYHQDFALHHPDDLYIVINDRPKVARLEKVLPELFRAAPAAYAAGGH